MGAVLPLQDVEPGDRPRVGGKAAGLARLVRHGLPVPPGFVVPAEVLAARLAALGLAPGAPGAPGAVREALLGAPLPAELERELVAAARALGGPVAVRSSAPEEDGRRRSWAGQHETLLAVAPEAVGAAVVRCWASAFSAAALAYGGGRTAPAMAVVVQAMVAPVVSGVMFTVNPLTGSWREMTVEAAWGLGEGLVSGQVTPHWYLVRRPRRAPRPVQRVLSRVQLHVVQEDLPELAERWVAGPGGGAVREPVPPRQRVRRTLDRGTLLRLCRLGLRVEGLMGEPQDVEWALAPDGTLVLLQSRPITRAGTPRSRKDVLWTRRFIGERWPEPATALGWSILAPILEWFIAYPGTQARFLGGGPAVRLVRGRPYMNVTVFRHLAFKLPGAPPPLFMLEFFPPEEESDWQRRFAVLPDVSVYASILRETFAERRWRRFRWNPLTNPASWDAFRARMDHELPPLCREAASEADALQLARAQIDLVREYCKIHVTSLLFANLFYQLLDGALQGLLPEHGARLMERLATCPPGNLTLEANEALWRLAGAATDEDLAALEAGLPPPGPAFAALLAETLRAYGHRSDASWEIFSPRWREAPERLAVLIRVHRDGAERPLQRARRQQEAYEAARAELERRLAGHRWAGATAWLVDHTRRYLLLRENQRFWFDELLFALKRTLSGLGARLAARGCLGRADDVAHLTWDEVVGLGDGSLPAEVAREASARRRLRREEDARVHPPVFLRGDEGVEEPEGGLRLQGLGISPGRARGRARIVRDVAEGHLLKPGEILVTRAVDPGWTPLFHTAAGVILEMGSRLSHGAVVAREYGLPAVVNLDGVTRRIADGQEVTVDGTRGVVWLH